MKKLILVLAFIPSIVLAEDQPVDPMEQLYLSAQKQFFSCVKVANQSVAELNAKIAALTKELADVKAAKKD